MVHTHGQRFDVNCSILFTELPLLKRPAAARAAGFEAVEFWWPFAGSVPQDREAGAFVEALGDAGVRLVGLNFAAGDRGPGSGDCCPCRTVRPRSATTSRPAST